MTDASQRDRQEFGTDLTEVRHEPLASPWRLRLYVAALVLFPFALILFTFWWVTTDSYLRHIPYPYIVDTGYGSKLQHADCDIVIDGDSTALVGVLPRIIEQRTGLKTCNISEVAGIKLVNGMMVLDDYLAHNRRPQYLVFVFAPENFNNPAGWTFISDFEGWFYRIRFHRDAAFWRRTLRFPDNSFANAELAFRNGIEWLLKRPLPPAARARTRSQRRPRQRGRNSAHSLRRRYHHSPARPRVALAPPQHLRRRRHTRPHRRHADAGLRRRSSLLSRPPLRPHRQRRRYPSHRRLQLLRPPAHQRPRHSRALRAHRRSTRRCDQLPQQTTRRDVATHALLLQCLHLLLPSRSPHRLPAPRPLRPPRRLRLAQPRLTLLLRLLESEISLLCSAPPSSSTSSPRASSHASHRSARKPPRSSPPSPAICFCSSGSSTSSLSCTSSTASAGSHATSAVSSFRWASPSSPSRRSPTSSISARAKPSRKALSPTSSSSPSSPISSPVPSSITRR